MEVSGTFPVMNDGSIELPIDGKPVKYVPLPTPNPDGTIEFAVNGNKPIRYAKESDLLAVKGVSQDKETEWGKKEAKYQTDLAEANRIREETYSQLIQAQAKAEQLTEQYKEFDTFKTKVGELETENGSLKESVTKYETEVTDRIRGNLINRGAKEEDLKEKTIDQLRSIEEAASLFGGSTFKRSYDEGPGGGNAPESPDERANRIIEEALTRAPKK